jgi:hypothetical protein
MATRQTNRDRETAGATLELARRYCTLFVNRLAYTVQSTRPGDNGKHYYYRPKRGRRLSLEAICDHLNGRVTIGLYSLNPQTQRSKWVAIDADYANALEDLLKLQRKPPFLRLCSVLSPRFLETGKITEVVCRPEEKNSNRKSETFCWT